MVGFRCARIAVAVAVLASLLVPPAAAAAGVGSSASTASPEPAVAAGQLGTSSCVMTADGSPFVNGTRLVDCHTPAGDPAALPGGWRLVWSDEFEGDAIDPARWNVLDRSTYGDGNLELACLMNRPENVRVGGGVLTISARRESNLKCGSNDKRFPSGRSYSSGHLETKTKASFEYGRFEVRAKTPTAHGTSKGIWPAFWMRPVRGGTGEIDIFENIGTSPTERNRANRTSQTIHHDYTTYPKQGTTYDLPRGTFDDGFHDYAVEWEPGTIRWYVDGALTWKRDSSTTPWLTEAFRDPFYLRLNLAVGGSWPGAPDANTAFPADFVVDHVRVYQR